MRTSYNNSIYDAKIKDTYINASVAFGVSIETILTAISLELLLALAAAVIERPFFFALYNIL